MASNWIKLRTDLQTDPAVIRLASLLGVDAFGVIGRFAAVWVWADTHADRHGHVTLVSRSCLDSITQCDGFGAALESVGWLKSSPEEGGGITFPRFDRHMGEGAKARAQAAKRKQKQRLRETGGGHASTPKMSRAQRDTCVTREEKRREEKIEEKKLPSEASSEPLFAASEPPPVITFPVTGKEREWPLSGRKLGEYEATYPGLDVAAALRAARQWCVDNSSKRKTYRGMPAFCSRWLERCQNRGQHLKTGPPGVLPFRAPVAKRTAADVVAEFKAKVAQEGA